MTEDLSRWLDDGNSIDIIYLDIKKAFDSVPHERLLTKLDSYVISDKFFEWMKHFLQERSQKVRAGTEFSLKE